MVQKPLEIVILGVFSKLMSIDKTLRFTQSRGFFIIKSLYQNDDSHI